MKKHLALILLIALAFLPVRVYAGPPMFGMDLTASPSSLIPDTDDTYDLGSTTFRWQDLFLSGSVSINALKYWSSATAEADEGTVVLPTITANYSGHGFVRISAAGVIADSAEFEVGSDGNVSLIRGTANVVVGAACADTKICISTAAAQNPVIVKARNGAGQLAIEFWYH